MTRKSSESGKRPAGGPVGRLGLEGERAEQVLDRISDAVYAVDRDLRISYVNRQFELQSGTCRDALIGRRVLELFPQTVGSVCHAALLRALRENCSLTFEARSAITDRWMEATVHPDEAGITIVMRDLTERKGQEEALRASRLFAERLVEICPAVLYVHDVPTGLSVYYNRDRKGTLGYSDADMAAMGNRRHQILMHPEDYARRPDDIARLAKLPDGETVTVEYRMRRKDGSWAWFHGEWAVFQRDETGAVTQILGSALNITERKRAEEQQQLLMGELSHRVKNTLAVVQAIASQSLRRAPSKEAFVDGFSGRLRALAGAHNLLTRTRWQPIRLRETVEQVIEPYAADDRKLTIGGPEVVLPPAATLTLSLVLHELATNAAKYGALSAPSGSVSIRWDLTDGGRESGEPSVRFEWSERGGPEVAVPTETGFGVTMIREAIAYDLRGDARLEFVPQGLRCEIVFPWRDGAQPGALS